MEREDEREISRAGFGDESDRPGTDSSEGAAPGPGGDHDADRMDLVDVLDAGALDVAREALARVDEILGTSSKERTLGESGPQDPPDRSDVSRRLRRGWDDVTTEVRALAATTDETERLASLIDVLNIVHTAEDVVGSSLTPRSSPVSRIRERLQSLDSASSLEEMLDHAPSTAAGLGFDRVLLSRVEESTWMPTRLYFKGDTRWADEVLEAMVKNPMNLNTSVLETQMVRQAVPLRVVDPASRPLMNRLMVTLSHTPGYIAAPITDGGRVVGFLHADCYYQGRVPSQSDVETLWLFTQALGPMLARQSLTERLAALRREIETPASILGPERPPRVARETAAPVRPVHPPAAQENPLHELVTRREAEVLRLMSEGASNEQIARRLVISVGTVKSHVKRILRKLDVANRAEAASLWLRSEYDRMSGSPAPR